MLKLPNVTLFAIDCFTPAKTLAALSFSTTWVRFANIILLTDTNKFQVKPNPWITVIHHEEGDRKAVRPNAPYHPALPVDYEMAVMREPAKYVKTTHLLHIEWDSAILNPAAWNDAWLKYDFIGAPWPPHHEPGWPACDGETNNVGNGGFSLKSRRFVTLLREATDLFKDDPGIISSDMWPCRTLRPWLEERGMKFAPDTVAERFSCENRIYSGQFGMHGRWTCEMNNWGGSFLGSIRPALTFDHTEAHDAKNPTT